MRERFASLTAYLSDDNVLKFKSPGYFTFKDEMGSDMEIVFYDETPLELILRRDSVYCINFEKGWDEIAYDVTQFNFYVDDYPSLKLVVD